eukprot:TRINITY_DN2956_c0_g1_i1.p1 TRINITY_DN2956_c0_g1~~TRINITY_DN2956_c0_g1_i1.p1  ORF type:complete len:580 (+),score=134.25 TRINITY_DN2956_c0_g1_i1:68-1807(+)
MHAGDGAAGPRDVHVDPTAAPAAGRPSAGDSGSDSAPDAAAGAVAAAAPATAAASVVLSRVMGPPRSTVLPSKEEDRKALARRLLDRHTARVPVVFIFGDDANTLEATPGREAADEGSAGSETAAPQLRYKCCLRAVSVYHSARRFLVQERRIAEDSELFLFLQGSGELLPRNVALKQIYREHRSPDQFLYVRCAVEATPETRLLVEREAMVSAWLWIFDRDGDGRLTQSEFQELREQLGLETRGPLPLDEPGGVSQAQVAGLLERAGLFDGESESAECPQRLRELAQERAGSGVLLFVNTPQGTLPVEVGAEAVVDDIRALVAVERGARAAKMYLSYQGQVLWDGGVAIADLGIGPESVLDLMHQKPSFAQRPAEQRSREAAEVLTRVGTGGAPRVPVVCHPAEGWDGGELKRPKRAVPSEHRVQHIVTRLRQSIGRDCPPLEITLEDGDEAVGIADKVCDLYAKHSAADGWLWLRYRAVGLDQAQSASQSGGGGSAAPAQAAAAAGSSSGGGADGGGGADSGGGGADGGGDGGGDGASGASSAAAAAATATAPAAPGLAARAPAAADAARWGCCHLT